MKNASKAMNSAVALAKEHGGRLTKHPGGFWAGREWDYLKPYASTKTVDALVARGLAYVSGTHTDRFRKTCNTEITLIPLPPASP